MKTKLSELPKNFFISIKTPKQFDYVVDSLKPINVNAWFIRKYGVEVEERFWYQKSVTMRFKHNKLDFGFVHKDYMLPTLSFSTFKKLLNSSRNSKCH